MATNETNVMTSHNLVNYSGMLFNKGDTRTPFSTMIGGKRGYTTSWAFPTSIDYETGGGVSQPAITETASLTAPNAAFTTRTQNSNVCQIYQEALSVSYAKQSSMGQLAGLNIAGAQANPATELDFQVTNAMAKIANDVEYVFLNGVYQDGNYDDVAYKTRGIMNAIETNVQDGAGAGLGYWIITELLEKIGNAGGSLDGLVLMTNARNILQLNADANSNGMTIAPSERTVNGIALRTLITPFGEIGIVQNQRIAAGNALIFNPAYCKPVEMPVPGKGNFFLESLSKTGAADSYQIYGQVGLDYGAEWCHGKITGLSTEFTAPNYGRSVFIAGGMPIPTVSTDAQITGATLNKSTVAASGTVSVSAVQYNVVPAEAATLAYLWQKKVDGEWTDLTASYTGYNTSELTVAAGDAAGTEFRCKVTATGTATGVVYSAVCTVAAA